MSTERLPQLLNIFVGQMSVIGYRPFATKHYQLYSDEVKQQINKIPPGLSGIGSVVFRNEEEILHSIDNAEYFHDEVITPYKGLLECWYVNNRSITNYFKLIVCTVLVVLYPSNNMWTKWFQGLPPVPENLKQHIL